MPLTEIEPDEPGSRNLSCYCRDPKGNVFEITEWLEPTGGWRSAPVSPTIV
jgi:hypothetical protein